MERRLYRSRRERILGGVCGGIAEYFGIDPAIVRIIAVLLILVGGGAILAYIVAWIIVPEEPREKEESTEDKKQEPRKEPNRQVLAWFLIIVGALWLSQFIVPLWTPFAPWAHRVFLPVLVLVLGVFLLLKR
ncbi:MAG: PspC domain-containing protein [Candidatus Caldatribacteriaceae bacterium]